MSIFRRMISPETQSRVESDVSRFFQDGASVFVYILLVRIGMRFCLRKSFVCQDRDAFLFLKRFPFSRIGMRFSLVFLCY